MEKISIILINYNGKKYNDKCIASILRSAVAAQIQIVVVDNASTDDSWENLQQSWGANERVHLISLDQNYGFSKGNNAGICWSMEQGIEYFLLLNNDTEVESDTIEKMYRCHLETKAIVVPKVLYSDRKDRIWCAGGDFSPVIYKAVQRGLNKRDAGRFDNSTRCQFANGCAMFLSKEIIEKIGFLDERFFLYYEDTEYSMRALAKDIPIWYCAQARVYHKVNGSTRGNENPDNAYYITRNWLLCNRLHMKGRFPLFLCYFLMNRLAWVVIWIVQRKPKMVRALLSGVKDFVVHKYGKRLSSNN